MFLEQHKTEISKKKLQSSILFYQIKKSIKSLMVFESENTMTFSIKKPI